MTTYARLIATLWLVVLAYWVIAAGSAKRNAGAQVSWRDRGLPLGIIVLALLAVRIPILSHTLRSERVAVAGSSLIGLVGVLFYALGVGLAVWARVHLGRNWGMPASRKDNPDLVTTGPYAFVRHPIYTGMLIAMLGTAIGVSIIWALPLVLMGVYFIYSARREEQLMLEQFPNQYPAYMKRTKMLVPWVL
jgi:protein-S-isoprenylcysteine O-methyltransferase Ste14